MTNGAVRGAAPWVERAARIGYASKGAVYILVGILATEAAFGRGGRKTGWSGAMREIASQPFGSFLLAIIALGLLGYVVWRILAAVADTEEKGTGVKGIAARSYYLGTAILHATLAAGAVSMLRGARSSGDDGGTAQATATAMDQPFGRWIVIAAGLVLLGYALYQVFKGVMTKLGKSLNLDGMEPSTRRWIVAISRIGLAARGIVFGVMGWFLLMAGVNRDAGQARGVGEALSAFDGNPRILAGVALGLASYGVYMLVKAKYRKIRTA